VTLKCRLRGRSRLLKIAPIDDVTHRPDPLNTSFEPFSVRIGATVRAGRVTK